MIEDAPLVDAERILRLCFISMRFHEKGFQKQDAFLNPH